MPALKQTGFFDRAEQGFVQTPEGGPPEISLVPPSFVGNGPAGKVHHVPERLAAYRQGQRRRGISGDNEDNGVLLGDQILDEGLVGS